MNPRRIWWLTPLGCVWALLGVAAVASYLIPANEYALLWRVPKYFDGMALGFCIGAAICISIGAGFANLLYAKNDLRSRARTATLGNLAGHRKSLDAFFLISFILTVIGYAVWTFSAMKSGVSLDNVIQGLRGDPGAFYIFKREVAKISGVTTMTQFGMAACIFGFYLYGLTKQRKYAIAIGIVLLLALLRARLHGERLALLECLIPIVVISLVHGARRWSRYLSAPIIGWIPFLVIPIFVLFFAAFEYSRSWKSYYEAYGAFDNVLEFAAYRLAGYYVTALNNGALFLQYGGYNSVPITTFEWLFRFPLLGAALSQELAFYLSMEAKNASLLSLLGNPEFNNPSGVLMYMQDWGMVLSIPFFMALGFLTQMIYRNFLRCRVGGMLLYPLVYVGLLEFVRVGYLTAARAFPSLLMLAFAVVAFNLSSRSRPLPNGVRNLRGVGRHGRPVAFSDPMS